MAHGPRIDLRSDTVTRPTVAMRAAMAEAEVGDDGYGEDPTVRELEERFAERLGKAAAVLVPSGTMANQIALRLLGRPGTAVIAGRRQHLVVNERGASGVNAPVQFHLTDDADGRVPEDEVADALAAVAHHSIEPSAVFVENTHMAAGGVPWPASHLRALATHGLPIHLDGARLFNAEVALGAPVAELAASATTVMCCLSKGLGAPIGSVLAGDGDRMAAARVERKRLGGSMRQAGVIAAAGLVALRDHVERLADDHVRARRLAEAVADRLPEAGLDPATVRTNIVVFAHADPGSLLAHLAAGGVLGGTVAPGRVRLVTHLDIDDRGIEQACTLLRSVPTG